MMQPIKPPGQEEVTRLLNRWRDGDRRSEADLFELLYQDLRAVARQCMSEEKSGHTLQATGLVHEAYLRLIDIRQVDWRDRAHFLAMAARVMRRVLVDHARRAGAKKRGGAQAGLTLATGDGAWLPPAIDLLDLEQALKELDEIDSGRSGLVELRYFGGLGMEEIAQVTGTSLRSVHRQWQSTRAWLIQRLSPGD